MPHVFGASVYRDLILSLGFSRVLQQIIYTYVYAYYMYMYLHILIAYVFTYTHTYKGSTIVVGAWGGRRALGFQVECGATGSRVSDLG